MHPFFRVHAWQQYWLEILFDLVDLCLPLGSFATGLALVRISANDEVL